MYTIKTTIFDLSLMVSIAISNIFYVLLNNNTRGAYILITEVDKLIPFVKYFIIPYVLWYPFIFIGLILIYFHNKKNYYKTLIWLNIGLIISYIIFYFFQTTVPRPILLDNDFITNIVKTIYNNDNPYNCFPSVHVITTYIVMRGLDISLKNKIINIIFQTNGLFIILSTVFVKQHVVLDIISAILIGEAVLQAFNFIKLDNILSKNNKESIKYNQ